MKKKGLMMIMTVAAMMVLSGCGTEVPNLSKLDNDKAAEYMAGAVLKYDSEYSYALQYDHSILNATPVPAPTANPTTTPEPAGGDEISNQTGVAEGTEGQSEIQQVSLTDVYGIQGVELDYVSASMKKSYGKGYESIMASKGKKLLIIYFKIKNVSGDSQKVDLSKNTPDFALRQNDRSIPPLHTAAQGDLQYFSEKLASGKSEQGVLMFEVDENIKVEENCLVAIDGTKQATITLP